MISVNATIDERVFVGNMPTRNSETDRLLVVWSPFVSANKIQDWEKRKSYFTLEGSNEPLLSQAMASSIHLKGFLEFPSLIPRNNIAFLLISSNDVISSFLQTSSGTIVLVRKKLDSSIRLQW